LGPVFESPDDLLQAEPGEYVQRWLADLREFDGKVRAVFGFCAGAALACAAADAIGGYGTGPQIVLFDPRTVNSQLLYQNFAGAIESFEEILTSSERVGALDAARAVVHSVDVERNFPPAVSAMCAAYEKVVVIAADRLGCGDDLVEQFVHHFHSFLAYLALAGRVDEWVMRCRPPGGRAAVLVSAAHVLPTGMTADLTLDVPPAHLLADPRLARAVTEILREAPNPREAP
jgi:hypothetical protein